MSVDIKDLRYFLAVVEEGTITRAAARLCMAQPPLSRQIQQLEEELGTSLFVRGKRRIQLTEEGIFLKQQAEEILSLVEKTENQLLRIKSSDRGIIAIGVTETCGASALAGFIRGFHNKYPNIQFNIWCGNGDEVSEKLEKGLVDIGLVRDPFNTEKYEIAEIKTEFWAALLSGSHPMARREGDTIELSEIAGEPLMIPARPPIQREIGSWFGQIAKKSNILCTYNTLSCIVPLVEQNTALAICPEGARYFTDRQRLVYKRIIKPEHFSRLLLVRRRHRLMPAATACFWDFSLDYIRLSGGGGLEPLSMPPQILF